MWLSSMVTCVSPACETEIKLKLLSNCVEISPAHLYKNVPGSSQCSPSVCPSHHIQSQSPIVGPGTQGPEMSVVHLNYTFQLVHLYINPVGLIQVMASFCCIMLSSYHPVSVWHV